MQNLTISSPFGALTITEDAGNITKLSWSTGGTDTNPLLEESKSQLDAYFAGTLTTFTLPLKVQGSDLQRRTCAAMQSIPFGETRTYGDLAKDLGASAQAIGQACGGNPIPIIIPCHRILGASNLGGFSGGTGIETKVALLKHEGAASLLI